MLKTKNDLTRPLRCFMYGRMSSDQQNPRSPDQQFDEIRRTIERQKLPWRVVGQFRDDGISGRYMSRRPGFQDMMRQVRTGAAAVDAVLVDSLERFGRSDEVPALRHELLSKYGVLVMTADTGFVDPRSQEGRALSFVEQVRATAVNEVKAHEVLRGKRDLAMSGRWPGGPAPLGKRLVRQIVTEGGREVTVTRMEPDPKTEWVVKELFRLAHESGRGQSWLAERMNNHPQLPPELKPFRASRVGHVLRNPIYVGELAWNRHCTGVVNDVRVIQKNPQEEVVRVPNFCPPVVPREQWEAVQALCRRRGDAIKAARKRGGDDKHVRTAGVGVVLRYPLTGLVYCANCGSRMAPCSSKGAARTQGLVYAYYRCPLRSGGGCANKVYVPERRLWEAVVGVVRARLLPAPVVNSDGSCDTPAWLAEVMDDVRAELAALAREGPDRRPALVARLAELDEQMAGWLQSLGKRELPAGLREGLEARYAEAERQRDDVRRELDALQNQGARLDEALDVGEVLERLRRLEQVLAGGSPTAVNEELALHVERIEVDARGRIDMRTSRIGALEGAVELLRSAGLGVAPPAVATPRPGDVTAHRVKSKRPTKRRPRHDEAERQGGVQQGADVAPPRGLDTQPLTQRLDAKWFWADPLPVRLKSCWSEDMAAEVAALRASDPAYWSLARLRQHFGKSVPTIRKALRAAGGREQAGEAARSAPRPCPQPPRPNDAGGRDAA